MHYITGIHALNLSCQLHTNGDWHASSLSWQKLYIKEIKDSCFDDWGIEREKDVPDQGKQYNVANHIRAVLDLMEDNCLLDWLKGFKRDLFGTDQYDDLFFEKVWQLKNAPHWSTIDELMIQEYHLKWQSYKEEMYACE